MHTKASCNIAFVTMTTNNYNKNDMYKLYTCIDYTDIHWQLSQLIVIATQYTIYITIEQYIMYIKYHKLINARLNEATN